MIQDAKCTRFKFLKFFTLFSFIVLVFNGCNYGVQEIFYRPGSVEDRTQKLRKISDSNVEELYSKDSFNFAVFTDAHYGKSNFSQPEDRFVDWLCSRKTDENKKIAFCVNLGDTADSGSYREYSEFNEFQKRIMQEAGIKVYSILGNHDLYNSGYREYVKFMHPDISFYKFETEKFSFYFIDTANGSLGDVQMEQLELAFKTDKKKKLVFSHYPMNGEGMFYFRLQNTAERNRLLALFARNNVKVISSGHTHSNNSTDFKAFFDLNYYSFGKNQKWILFHIDQKNEAINWEFVE